MTGPLVCPRCATSHPADERLCPTCGMPVVPEGGGEAQVTPAQAWARKVKPSYAEGDLFRVVTASNLVEAEFIQSLLLEEGIPSTLQRTAGFDVPEMLAAGPRDVMVPRSGFEAAREMLLDADLLPTSQRTESPLRLAVWLTLAFVVVGAVVWGGTELVAM
ncbi:MAG: DUF2007 domain-containing protein [Solirubrobacteraceae bacterium]|nr:DUF2007 domain-containing protein [Solirubrobacteraceae bacterium]